MALLTTRRLTRFFGGLAAVLDLDMEVERGEIIGLIGPNGAGKSTLLNMIGGTLLPSQGQIIFEGEEITRLPSHRRAERSISRVFQENLLFESFTAIENVQVGFHLQARIGLASSLFETRSRREYEDTLRANALKVLDLVGLSEYVNELAINLPHGRQRLLSLAIALAGQPKLLLLDEPVTGMNAE
jgi:branched-chain amino acid transport system ATP-binding protein